METEPTPMYAVIRGCLLYVRRRIGETRWNVPDGAAVIRFTAQDLDEAIARLDALLASLRAEPAEDDGGVRETERRHSRACRDMEATRQREADILQAGYELGRRRAKREADER